MAHAPGPWELASLPTKAGRNKRGLCGGGRRICDISVYDDRDAANARLIAAAPELLEALKVAELALRAHGAGSTWDADQVRAAIAKALGQ